jgi:hypothetical protein
MEATGGVRFLAQVMRWVEEVLSNAQVVCASAETSQEAPEAA